MYIVYNIRNKYTMYHVIEKCKVFKKQIPGEGDSLINLLITNYDKPCNKNRDLNFPWYKLPTHVVQHILSYTYNIQPKKLLDDIKNYYKTQKLLFVIQPVQLITHDLYNFINWFQYDYVYSYYSTFLRHYMLNNNVSVIRFIQFTKRLHIKTQINILWGLMRPAERDEFISIIISYYKPDVEHSFDLA